LEYQTNKPNGTITIYRSWSEGTALNSVWPLFWTASIGDLTVENAVLLGDATWQSSHREVPLWTSGADLWVWIPRTVTNIKQTNRMVLLPYTDLDQRELLWIVCGRCFGIFWIFFLFSLLLKIHYILSSRNWNNKRNKINEYLFLSLSHH
jgi:hypothetical protein